MAGCPNILIFMTNHQRDDGMIATIYTTTSLAPFGPMEAFRRP